MDFRRGGAADILVQPSVRCHRIQNLVQAERVLRAHAIHALIKRDRAEPGLDPQGEPAKHAYPAA